MATLTILGSGASNGNMVETYMPYATYKSAAVVSVETGSDVGICSSSKTIMWDKSAIPTNDSGWYVFAVNEDLWIDLSASPVVVTTKDPAAPPGDHNTLIDGTAREIEGGSIMVGGTVYEIEKGKTLVGGTAYEIAFAFPITVTITGGGNATSCYVTINGKNYSSAATLVIESGTEITATAVGSGFTAAGIKFNGAEVGTVETNTKKKIYTFVPDTEAVNIKLAYSSSQRYITITTS